MPCSPGQEIYALRAGYEQFSNKRDFQFRMDIEKKGGAIGAVFGLAIMAILKFLGLGNLLAGGGSTIFEQVFGNITLYNMMQYFIYNHMEPWFGPTEVRRKFLERMGQIFGVMEFFLERTKPILEKIDSSIGAWFFKNQEVSTKYAQKDKIDTLKEFAPGTYQGADELIEKQREINNAMAEAYNRAEMTFEEYKMEFKDAVEDILHENEDIALEDALQGAWQEITGEVRAL